MRLTRQVGATMRDSVYAQILWAIDKLGHRNSNAHKAHCSVPTPTGSAFCSVDWMIRRKSNPSSCRSVTSASCGLRKPTKSRAAKMPCAMCSSPLRGGEFGLNYQLQPPAASRNWQTATPARNARASASIIRPTCKPLPHGSAKFLAQAEYIKETQPTKYRHEYLARSSAARRYLKICGLSLSRKRLSETSTPFKTVLTGLVSRPVAFNRCHYDAARKTLYIFDELTRLRTSNEETAKLVQQRIESWRA